MLLDYIETLETVLETELFTRLFGEEPTTLKKYIYVDNLGKPDLPEKLLYIHQTIYYLSGTYNEQGIQRWFQRERAQLDKKSPLQYLGNNWRPYDENAKVVLELARSNLGPSGAT